MHNLKHVHCGRTLYYSADTEFLVQTGNIGGGFKTIKVFTGDPAKAIKKYQSLHLARDRKARVLMPTSSFPIVCGRSSTVGVKRVR